MTIVNTFHAFNCPEWFHLQLLNLLEIKYIKLHLGFGCDFIFISLEVKLEKVVIS